MMTIDVMWPPLASLDRFDVVCVQYVLSDVPDDRWTDYFFGALRLGANLSTGVEENRLRIVGVTPASAYEVLSSVHGAIQEANAQRDAELDRAHVERDAVQDMINSAE
jgi:hypothetical protein